MTMNSMRRKLALAVVSLAKVLTVPSMSNAGGLFLTEFGTEDIALDPKRALEGGIKTFIKMQACQTGGAARRRER